MKIAHKKEYEKNREKIIYDWEKNTGNKWPEHPNDMMTKSGISHPRAGTDHDFHHIIPQEYGGPNQWWNGIPLKSGKHHQDVINDADSPLNKILNGNK